jgi:hypothetical protein
VLIPNRAQFACEAFADLGLERTRQLVAADFEPGQCGRPAIGNTEIVMPDAAHAESHRAHDDSARSITLNFSAVTSE